MNEERRGPETRGQRVYHHQEREERDELAVKTDVMRETRSLQPERRWTIWPDTALDQRRLDISNLKWGSTTTLQHAERDGYLGRAI